MKIKDMTEREMRDAKVPWPKTQKELDKYISELVKKDHDYGTCVYAMSMAAVAAFYYVSHKLGVTGFQAGCADLDILRRTRHMEDGFTLLDYSNLLYPQYLNEDNFPSHEKLLEDNKDRLAKKAKQLLKDKDYAHPNVKARWEYIAGLS